ncbi:MAG: hypothetical protein HY707_06270 [Ignavibacteriae bacterium]|nr:hypothetical protein [Ignavibacteriota bacterium]
MRKYIHKLLAIVMLVGGVLVTGCASNASEEELAQLDALKKEVSSLEIQVRDKKSEKANLEKQIAETNGKIQQCQSDQEAVKKAMGGQ